LLDQIWNTKGGNGQTPLHIAARVGNDMVVSWVIKTWEQNQQPLDVNALDNDGVTPLFLACQQGYFGSEYHFNKED
jgi:ankyrin repeat protein